MTFDDYKVVILEQAEKDITEILDYIYYDLKNPQAAKKLRVDIREAITRVRMFPYAMPVIKNEVLTLGNEYRRLDVNNYALLYKIIEDLKEIHIMAVLYGPSNMVSKVLSRVEI